MLIVTSFAAAFLALFLVLLSILTIAARLRFQVGLGDNGENALIKFIRAQGNLTEFAPIFLILIGLVELNHFLSSFWLWAIATAFICGRVSHAASLLFIEPKTLRFRQLGMALTFIPLVILSLILIFKLIANLFF
jgi:uncharacterized membrane protein YecN with MAPEG domain